MGKRPVRKEKALQEENQWLWEVTHCTSTLLATHKTQPSGPIHLSCLAPHPVVTVLCSSHLLLTFLLSTALWNASSMENCTELSLHLLVGIWLSWKCHPPSWRLHDSYTSVWGSGSFANDHPPSSCIYTSSGYLLGSSPSTAIHWLFHETPLAFGLVSLSLPTFSPAIIITHCCMNAYYLYGQPPPNSPYLQEARSREPQEALTGPCGRLATRGSALTNLKTNEPTIKPNWNGRWEGDAAAITSSSSLVTSCF